VLEVQVRGGGTADRVNGLEAGAASGFPSIGRGGKERSLFARGFGMLDVDALLLDVDALLLDSEAGSGRRNAGGRGMLSAVAWGRGLLIATKPDTKGVLLAVTGRGGCETSIVEG
jgi:hypothetical protein